MKTIIVILLAIATAFCEDPATEQQQEHETLHAIPLELRGVWSAHAYKKEKGDYVINETPEEFARVTATTFTLFGAKTIEIPEVTKMRADSEDYAMGITPTSMITMCRISPTMWTVDFWKVDESPFRCHFGILITVAK